MWPFSVKKTIASTGMLSGFTDWHSHILPGVDDGVGTLEESLRILDAYSEAGIKRVWLTPHIMEEYPNATDDLRRRFDELTKAYKGPVELRLASENMLDPVFEERLRKRDLLPIGDEGTHLLVETSYYNPPVRFYEMLDDIKSAGYFPVLAHPERYRYMHRDEYIRLADSDVMLQTNLFSLTGIYGEHVIQKAKFLLEKGLLSIAGTDIHSEKMLRFFDKKIDGKRSLKTLALLKEPSRYPF